MKYEKFYFYFGALIYKIVSIYNLREPTRNFSQKFKKKFFLLKKHPQVYGGDASQNIRGVRVLEPP